MDFNTEDNNYHNPLFSPTSVPIPISGLKKDINKMLVEIDYLRDQDPALLLCSKADLFELKIELKQAYDEAELEHLLMTDINERMALVIEDTKYATEQPKAVSEETAKNLSTTTNMFSAAQEDFDSTGYDMLQILMRFLEDVMRDHKGRRGALNPPAFGHQFLYFSFDDIMALAGGSDNGDDEEVDNEAGNVVDTGGNSGDYAGKTDGNEDEDEPLQRNGRSSLWAFCTACLRRK